MANLTSLSVLLKGDASELVKATRTGLGALKKFGVAASKAIAVGGAAGIGGLAGSAGALAALGHAARGSIDAHAKNAARLGITVEQAQRLTLAAGQSDVKIRTLNTAMATLAREAGKAGAGSEKSAAKFAALGISMEEINRASPFELLKRVIGALGETDKFTERAAKANDLFGESWLKLNPLIEGGAGAFANADLVFRRLGLGLGDGAGKAEAFGDSLETLLAIGTALRDKVFEGLAPQLADFAAKLVEAAAAFVEAQGGGAKLAQTLGSELVASIKSIIGFFGDLKMTIDTIASVIGGLASLVKGAWTGIAGLAAAGASVLRGEFSGAGRVLSALPGDISAQFGVDTGEAQLEESKRQTNLLEELTRTFGPVFR